MNRYIANNFDYGMSGIGAGGSSTTSGTGNNRESNASLYYASTQTANEAGGYHSIHETFGLQQEPDFSQATSRGMFYHDPRPGAATNSTTRVSGEYNSGMAAPGYMLQQPAAAQYLNSFHRRRPPENMYREPTTTSPGASHFLGNNQTILAAARELCGSPFEDYSYQQETPPVHIPRLTPSTPVPTPCSRPLQCHSPAINEEESLQPDKTTSSHDDEGDELINFIITIPSLSLTSLTGKELVDRVLDKAHEVVSRYLPCVELLVACQQDLRAGLNQKSSRRGMVTSQFFSSLLEPLPERFYDQNQYIMPIEKLQGACDGIQELLADAKKVERSGCEGMKNAFLGGMRDGESWGLRRWLSKNGGALQICNDLELILGALKKLPKAEKHTRLLAERIGPKAKTAYDKLKDEVPNAYQEVSSAHPYLPFFHRLESALKGLHEFDPNDDGVICIDDDSSDEDTVLEVGTCSGNNMKKYNSNFPIKVGTKRDLDTDSAQYNKEKPRYERSGADSPVLFKGLVDEARKPPFDGDSDIEIVCVKKAARNESGTDLLSDSDVFETSSVTASQKPVNEKFLSEEQLDKGKGTAPTNYEYGAYGLEDNQNNMFTASVSVTTALELAENVEKIVQALETGLDIRPQAAQGCRDFWSNTCNFIVILRLFQKLIQDTASQSFLDPVDRNEYINLIKNPLCFRDIVAALCNDDSCESYAVNGARIVRKTGVLECSGLKKWNMFEGSKLIQAVDLVFLNNLAFMGKSADLPRKSVMRMRKYFWGQIRSRALGNKDNIPTKRKETSGFVVRLK